MPRALEGAQQLKPDICSVTQSSNATWGAMPLLMASRKDGIGKAGDRKPPVGQIRRQGLAKKLVIIDQGHLGHVRSFPHQDALTVHAG